jgi:hypothetical protein
MPHIRKVPRLVSEPVKIGQYKTMPPHFALIATGTYLGCGPDIISTKSQKKGPLT